MIASLLPFLLAAPSDAAPAVLPYEPYCALPGTAPTFVSPMGEPFRGEPGQAYPSAAWIAGADRDRDGALDRAEFVRDADRFFKTLDIDHDGRLTPAEIDRYERIVAPEIALYGPRGRAFDPPGAKPKNGESGYGGPMGAGRYTWLNIPEPVASGDLDMNRIIDEREFAATAGRRFDQLAPGGRLTLAALPKTPQQAALEGPCQKRPKPRKPRKGDDGRDAFGNERDRDEGDGGNDRGGDRSGDRGADRGGARP